MGKDFINVSDRHRWKKKQIRRMKKRIIRTFVYVVVGVSALFLLKAVMNTEDHTEEDGTKSTVTTDMPTDQDTQDPGDTVQDQSAELTAAEKRKVIEEHPELYPEEFRELAQRNEEALDFILAYPEKKDTLPAQTIGDIAEGEIPLLIQWDERWGYSSYGDSTIAVSGCGPTALAMVVSGLTGDPAITPFQVAKYSEENGYYAGSEGTSWALMSEAGYGYDVWSREIPLVENNMIEELQIGHPIICSVKKGDFTEGGHFIVLTGVKDGKFQVNDPNSRVRSERLWSFDELSWQIDNIWVFTRK